ncbi:MAG TPA: phosphodiesterase [Gaiellaceae bacterium]
MSRPFLLVQLSDPHLGASWDGDDPGSRLAAAVDAVLALDPSPDAVLVSGDLAEHGADEEYAAVRAQLERIDAPLHVLPGNHDDRESLRGAFGLPGDGAEPVQYAAGLGPLRLVVLDSTLPGEDGGELGSDRLAWLEAQLDAEPETPTVIALHHPPLAIGIPAWDAIGLPGPDRAALGEVVARHPQVRLIVAGHVHRAITGQLGGRAVLTVPSTYMQGLLRFGSTEILLSDDPPGFAVHALVDGELVSHVQPVRP